MKLCAALTQQPLSGMQLLTDLAHKAPSVKPLAVLTHEALSAYSADGAQQGLMGTTFVEPSAHNMSNT